MHRFILKNLTDLKGEKIMNFDQESLGVRISMPIIRREVNSDICEDYTLPDYYPEIRKLLFARPSPLLPAKFVSGGRVDVNGVIDYTLVYVSADGKLCSAPLSAEYSFALPIENMSDFELGEGLDVVAHTICESTSVRVSAPRKLQLRSHLRSSLSVWGKMLCAEKSTGGEDGVCVERLRARGECGEIFCESSDVISLEDSFDIAPEERIALADGIVTLKDLHRSDDIFDVSGEILIKMLLTDDSTNEQKSILRRLPFEAQIELDGIDLPSASKPRACGYLTDLAINVEEGRARISADALLEICTCYNRELEYTADAYSISADSECAFRELRLPVVDSNSNSSLSICERISLEELAYPEGAHPIEAFASASVDSLMLEDGKYILRGNCRYNVISMRDGEYMGSEFTVPFRYEQDAGEGNSELSFDATASVKDVKVKAESDALCFECELMLGLSVFGERKIRMLESIEIYPDSARKSGEIIVCYPTDEDTRWSVAKRYAVLQDEIFGDVLEDDYVIIET